VQRKRAHECRGGGHMRVGHRTEQTLLPIDSPRHLPVLPVCIVREVPQRCMRNV
jgi:hypothetical protein